VDACSFYFLIHSHLAPDVDEDLSLGTGLWAVCLNSITQWSKRGRQCNEPNGYSAELAQAKYCTVFVRP
jgi:hypothetical protein